MPLDDSRTLYYTVAVIFVLGLLCVYRITHSTFGQVLRSIRDNEPRAISLGFDANRFKLLAFTLSATLAGVAGATKAIAFKLATLTDVHWSTSGAVILMTVLGGLGTFWGPVVGAIVVVTLEDYLADFGLPIDMVDRRDFHCLHPAVPPRRGGRIADSAMAPQYAAKTLITIVT